MGEWCVDCTEGAWVLVAAPARIRVNDGIDEVMQAIHESRLCYAFARRCEVASTFDSEREIEVVRAVGCGSIVVVFWLSRAKSV